MNINLLIILAIVISIALGYLFKINIGLFAIAFGYIIGVFILDLKVSAVVAMWPTKIFFILLTISMFYGFANVNGTLEKLAKKAVYATRNLPYLLPITIFVLSAVLSGIGAGAYAVIALMVPIALSISSQTDMSPLLGALSVSTGSVIGATLPISVSGLVINGLIESAGYAELASFYTANVFWKTLIANIVFFIVAYVLLKGFKINVAAVNMEKPEPFDSKQKMNIILLACVLVLIVIPPLINTIVPGIPFIKMLTSKIDLQFLAVIGTIVAIFLKIGDFKDVMKIVPWNTIILICGVGILIAVAVQAGTIQWMADYVSNNTSSNIAPYAIMIVAAFMSFFSSSTGVVMPTLYPVVPGIVAATGANPALLFAIITIGASCTGMSPFSSGRAITLSGVTDEKVKDELFTQLLFVPAAMVVVGLLTMLIGILGR